MIRIAVAKACPATSVCGERYSGASENPPERATLKLGTADL